MNSQRPMIVYAWSADLDASRDVNERQRDAFGMVLGWLEHWRVRIGAVPGRESCVRFWREQVMMKDRQGWQLEQWSGAIQWYLRWLKYRQDLGGEVLSLEERVRRAVEGAGARRGLARRTRETYGRWAAGFARWGGGEHELLKTERASGYVPQEQITHAEASLDSFAPALIETPLQFVSAATLLLRASLFLFLHRKPQIGNQQSSIDNEISRAMALEWRVRRMRRCG